MYQAEQELWEESIHVINNGSRDKPGTPHGDRRQRALGILFEGRAFQVTKFGALIVV